MISLMPFRTHSANSPPVIRREASCTSGLPSPLLRQNWAKPWTVPVLATCTRSPPAALPTASATARLNGATVELPVTWVTSRV